MMAKLMSRRGPMYGRGPGKRWGGIVEKTPCVWITWIVAAAKTAGLDPMTLQFTFWGVKMEMTRVKLTFGWRHYWLCPRCARRCEAIYYNGRVGCQECLNLGYLSESHRLTSIWIVLSRLNTRWPFSRRTFIEDKASQEMARTLRGEFERRLNDILAGLNVKKI